VPHDLTPRLVRGVFFALMKPCLTQHRSKCGSGLARECGVSVNWFIGWPTAFASKPAPTRGMCAFWKFCAKHWSRAVSASTRSV